jgi:hypothetical protein
MAMAMRITRSFGTVLCVAAAAVAPAACGSSSSSKPSYCQDKSNLQSSVSGLSKVDVRSNGLSALQSQLEKIESNAKALVTSATSEFRTETSAISSSVNALKTAAGQLSSSPSISDVRAVTLGVSNVVTAVEDFTNAVASRC